MAGLHTTYFGSVDWYRELLRTSAVVDDSECYRKQTDRNHCVIATANGVQKLTVPVTVPTKNHCPIRDVRVSDHGNWRHQHWEALCSAYGMSPFFEYYADDIRPFFEQKWDFLFDFNAAITSKILDLIGVNDYTEQQLRSIIDSRRNAAAGITGNRETATVVTPQAIARKKESEANASDSPIYYQTFQLRHGFIPHLSILDLLFNEGPEAITFIL